MLFLVTFVNKNEFFFGYHTDDLILSNNGNLFSHATLKGDFTVLDLDNTYDNTNIAYVSCFDSNSESVKWHDRLGHVIGWEGYLKKVF